MNSGSRILDFLKPGNFAERFPAGNDEQSVTKFSEWEIFPGCLKMAENWRITMWNIKWSMY